LNKPENIDNAMLKSHAFHKSFDAPFDTGWREFPQHYLLYASAGSFNLEIDDKRWLLPPQRAALIAARMPIRIWTTAPVTSSSVLFADAEMTMPDSACKVFACSALAIEMIRHAMRWDAQRIADNDEANTFFRALAAICEELAESPAQTWLPRASSKELQRALDYTLDHLQDELTVDIVAQAACVSRRTLARRFADELGFPWPKYLRRARLIRAAELLTMPNANTSLVANAVGFTSTSAFINAYKAFFDETPMQTHRRLHGVI
jgi:AraC-like DNA-binding protein